MVYRIHYDAANFGPMSQPAVSARLSKGDIAVLDVPYLADCRIALDIDSSNFAGWQPELRPVTFFGHQLSRAACRPHHLRALAGPQFDVVDCGAKGNVSKGEGVA